ncbi:MAG: hypothetical protein JO276_17025 [Sphingomonadaceae bacterium]|nr:hypothetical protein [Sphingomonadaceae bacterium]
MTDRGKRKRIGLLFVHGVGEQKRWEHLKSSTQELAELLLQTRPSSRLTVTDRTDDWPHPPGEPDPSGLAPITLAFDAGNTHVDFDCHEVWWADLGARSGLGDVVSFWFWGLGQWCAPIYRELDASRLPKHKVEGIEKPVSCHATLPESVAGNLASEPLARLQLVLAALAAIFVACTWSLAKRLFAALLGQAPSPTLIVRYVGDVRTYESRAAPGDSALSDPGRPRRVGIRRRMVSEMVALATEPCEGWYVLAHSLGTVLAYNGLTETGHALPNYLSQEQWQRVPDDIKRDPNCERREDISAMMPTRPHWLEGEDVIDRQQLLARLRGFLTYGSPLDKFASLWPRIVATATDRKDGKSPFPEQCHWINLVAPSDPVAGTLDSYSGTRGWRIEHAVPRVENCRAPWTPLYGLAHIRYFSGVERYAKGNGSIQKQAVAKWLLDPTAEIKDHPQNWVVRLALVQLAYPLLVVLLWLVTTLFVVVALDTFDNLTGWSGARLGIAYGHWKMALPSVLAAALTLIVLTGVYRWARESWLNVRLAAADAKADKSRNRKGYWARLIWMLRLQAAVGSVFTVLCLLAMIFTALLGWGSPARWAAALSASPEMVAYLACLSARLRAFIYGWGVVIAALVTLPLAAVVQTMLNRIMPPVGKAPG